MNEFSDVLLSPSLHPSIPETRDIFKPFLGSWALIVRWFDDRGDLARQEDGEWHFARVLEGRGIQDVWIVPPRGQRGTDDYEYGTSLRFHDPSVNAWRSTWIGPMRGAVVTFLARKVDDRVVLETTPDMPVAHRWTFQPITADEFRWSNEERDETGWRTVQTFEATRLR